MTQSEGQEVWKHFNAYVKKSVHLGLDATVDKNQKDLNLKIEELKKQLTEIDRET